MINKIILVAMPCGRVGSSAMMGTLRLSDRIELPVTRAESKWFGNPKGGFESDIQERFLREHFGAWYPGRKRPPAYDKYSKISNQLYGDYKSLLGNMNNGGEVFAVKSQRMLTVGCVSKIKNIKSKKILYMKRGVKDQANSLHRVWSNKRLLTTSIRETLHSIRIKQYRYDETLKWLKEWRRFSRTVLEHTPVDYHEVKFSDLIEKPVDTTTEVFKFIEEEPPNEKLVNEWIDGDLANTQKEPDNFINRLVRKISNKVS